VTRGAAEAPVWRTPWQAFKTALPHQQPPYARRNWGHGLHSLCSYQGKMKPSLAHHLVATFMPPGGRLLDPFAGVGTVPFEAALQGRHALGFEISSAALPIAAAKLAQPDPAAVAQVLDALAHHLAHARPRAEEHAGAAQIRFNGALTDYFHPATLDEVLLARRFFAERVPHRSAEQLVLACLLHILHGNRPYALSRRSHPITPFAPSGPSTYRGLLERLRMKVDRSLAAPLPTEFVPGTVLACDATAPWPDTVQALDAVVTSPPFFQSTRFHLGNWMRLWFSGWQREDFLTRPKQFLDERQKSGLAVYAPIFRQARERLRSHGVLVLHLGQSRKCDMAAGLAQIAAPWFRVADRFDEPVDHCESHGIRDKGSVTAHQFLVLEPS
jgi:hypothetical protein